MKKQLYKVKLYDNQNNEIYETTILAFDQDDAIEKAWDEYHCGGYGDAQAID